MTQSKPNLPFQGTIEAIALLLLLLAVPTASAFAFAFGQHSSVVVANRGAGSISVVDDRSLGVTTVDLPGEAEPMYVSSDPRHHHVLVGDRSSSSVVVFDDETYRVLRSIPVGAGVFHQWLDVDRRQLWVVGDTSSTVSVVDSRTLRVIATIAVPADVISRGGRPHDVFVDGNHAFVSILGLSAGGGEVIRYSTHTFTETGRISVGGDPHLFVRAGTLFVASQQASMVSRYRAATLQPLGSTDVPSAHGIFVTNRGELLVTNIAGGGTDALWKLDVDLGVEDVADTSLSTPHNITIDDRRRMFVTHSGTNNQLSVVDLDRDGFGATTLVTVGTNPFGIAFVR